MRKMFFLLIAISALIINLNVINAQQKMIIYVIESEPLGFIDDKGSPSGAHYEVIAELSKRSKIPIDIKIIPKARLVKEVIDGKADAGIFVPTPDVKDLIVNAGVCGEVKLVAFNIKGKPLTKYEDLYNSKLIALIPNMSFSEKFDADSKLKKEIVDSYEVMMEMLKNSRIDTITGGDLALLYLLKKLKLTDKIDKNGLTFKTINNFLFISKKSPFIDKADLIKSTLDSMMKDGTIKRIYGKYSGE